MGIKRIPKKGEKVNDKRRIPHANGVVRAVLYSDGPDEVLVTYDDDIVCYDIHDFDYTWTDKFGGAYELDRKS